MYARRVAPPVAAPANPSSSVGFTFRRLGKPEELRAAEELQRVAVGGADEAPVPVPVLRAVQDHGGIVLGAFADIYLAGLSVGFLGWDGQALYHYVHRFVVRPEYLHHGLGRRLAAVVRDEARQQGLETLRGTYDPLSSRAAYLTVHVLGGRPERYLVHHYGQSPDPAAVDRESDRVRWLWAIADPAIDERLAARPDRAASPDPRFAAAVPIVETEPGETGLRLPTAVAEPSAATVTLEIPFDIDLIREHEPVGARRWRHAVRDAFRASFDLGYRVVDFAVSSTDHERRSYYLLEAGPTPPPPA